MKNTLWGNLLIVIFVGFVVSTIFGTAQNAAKLAQKAALIQTNAAASLLEY